MRVPVSSGTSSQAERFSSISLSYHLPNLAMYSVLGILMTCCILLARGLLLNPLPRLAVTASCLTRELRPPHQQSGGLSRTHCWMRPAGQAFSAGEIGGCRKFSSYGFRGGQDIIRTVVVVVGVRVGVRVGAGGGGEQEAGEEEGEEEEEVVAAVVAVVVAVAAAVAVVAVASEAIAAAVAVVAVVAAVAAVAGAVAVAVAVDGCL